VNFNHPLIGQAKGNRPLEGVRVRCDFSSEQILPIEYESKNDSIIQNPINPQINTRGLSVRQSLQEITSMDVFVLEKEL
jgi:hypothetical protein